MRGKQESPVELPKFHKPEVVMYKKEPIFIGREDGSVTCTTLGPLPGPNLLVGEEEGRLVIYERAHLSTESRKFDVKETAVVAGDDDENPFFIEPQVRRKERGSKRGHTVDTPMTKEEVLAIAESQHVATSSLALESDREAVAIERPHARISVTDPIARKQLREDTVIESAHPVDTTHTHTDRVDCAECQPSSTSPPASTALLTFLAGASTVALVLLAKNSLALIRPRLPRFLRPHSEHCA
eukprot:jgi/Chlat1/8779/Chrsp90S08131